MSTDEEEQTDLSAELGLESSEEEGEGSVWKEESTEEEDGGKEQKAGTKKKAETKNEQAPSKASATEQQVREESGSSEEEAMQGRAKMGESTGAKRHKESDDSDEETLAKKKGHREPRQRGNKGKRMSSKQKSRRTRGVGEVGS